MHSLLDILLDGERRVRTPWRFLIFGIGFFAVSFVLEFAVSIALYAYFLVAYPMGTDGEVGRQFGDWIATLHEEHWALMAVLTPLETLGLFGLTVLCRVFLDRRRIRSMGYQ